MIGINPEKNTVSIGVVVIESREAFERFTSALNIAAEAVWPTPDEPPKRKRNVTWTKEQRDAASERMKARMKARPKT